MPLPAGRTATSKSEEAAQEASSRIKQILEATTDSVFLLNEHGCLVFFNQVAKNTMADGKDLIGETIWEILPAPSGESSEAQYRQAGRNCSTLAFEGVRTGSKDVFEVKVQPSGNGLAIFVRNVTSQRLVELALRKVEERYSIATRSITEGI